MDLNNPERLSWLEETVKRVLQAEAEEAKKARRRSKKQDALLKKFTANLLSKKRWEEIVDEDRAHVSQNTPAK